MNAPVRSLLATGALALLFGAACASRSGAPWLDSGGGEAGESLAAATRLLDAGDYEAAGTVLRGLAARCETGPHGRQAVLYMAMAALDPRNGSGSADEAARLAAHVLRLPGGDTGERVVAETLFLLALDQGGRPASVEQETGTSVSGLASRYRDCDAGSADSVAQEPGALPELPGLSTADLLVRVRAERDSLWQRVTRLEAELERIRGLLQEGVRPDTLRRP